MKKIKEETKSCNECLHVSVCGALNAFMWEVAKYENMFGPSTVTTIYKIAEHCWSYKKDDS